MPYDVFLSYADEDYEFVAQLAAGFRTAGLSVWFDRDILTKEETYYGNIIENGIIESRFAIAVISMTYLSKKWPEAEFGAIRRLEKHENRDKIIVILHGAPAVTFGVPFGRTPVKYTLSSEEGVDHAVADCVRLIQQMTEEQTKMLDVPSDYKYIFPLGHYSYCGDTCPVCGARMVVGNHSYWCSKCDYINEMEPV
jgi:hypothetical protein